MLEEISAEAKKSFAFNQTKEEKFAENVQGNLIKAMRMIFD